MGPLSKDFRFNMDACTFFLKTGFVLINTEAVIKRCSTGKESEMPDIPLV